MRRNTTLIGWLIWLVAMASFLTVIYVMVHHELEVLVRALNG